MSMSPSMSSPGIANALRAGYMSPAQAVQVNKLTSPLSTTKWVDSPNGISTVLYPDAPAGYLNCASGLRLNNAGAGAVLATITDDLYGIVCKVSVPVGGVAGPSTGLVLSGKGAHILAAGAGVSAQLLLEQSPTPSDLLFARVVLTSSYQVVPLTIPAGKIAKPISFSRDLNVGGMQNFMMNADNASSTMLLKYTRGGQSFEFTSAAQGNGGSGTTNGRLSFVMQALETGDVLEAKTLVAPGIAGSCILFVWYVLSDKA